MIEERCVTCGCPCSDHIPFRYWFAAWWRHRFALAAGFILGSLPFADTQVDF